MRNPVRRLTDALGIERNIRREASVYNLYATRTMSRFSIGAFSLGTTLGVSANLSIIGNEHFTGYPEEFVDTMNNLVDGFAAVGAAGVLAVGGLTIAEFVRIHHVISERLDDLEP